MAAYNFKELKKKLDARTLRERGMLFTAVVVVIAYSWYLLSYEALNLEESAMVRQIGNMANQISAELNRNQEIQNSYTRDPNVFVNKRIKELQAQIKQVDGELISLYGELILSQQMAGVLTEILQSETTLELISFENLPPEKLFESEEEGIQEESGINVFRHGLRMEFHGDYLETIRFLKKVESLSTSFFWDDFVFAVGEHPDAKISLNIFTLSTEEGFIGV